jgi:TatA/E family protein of Tat protein translocase
MFGLVVIALLVFLLLGASRLGEVGTGLGEGVRAFKKSLGSSTASKKKKKKKRRVERETVDDDGVWERRRISTRPKRRRDEDEGEGS